MMINNKFRLDGFRQGVIPRSRLCIDQCYWNFWRYIFTTKFFQRVFEIANQGFILSPANNAVIINMRIDSKHLHDKITKSNRGSDRIWIWVVMWDDQYL